MSARFPSQLDIHVVPRAGCLVIVIDIVVVIIETIVSVGEQQLQHRTEPSFSDFACIGRCLSRLGDFLSRLNDSIECSTAAVTAALAASPPSPKPPRRRFHLSFRSSMDTDHRQPPAVRDPLRKYGFRLHRGCSALSDCPRFGNSQISPEIQKSLGRKLEVGQESTDLFCLGKF